MNGGSGKPNNDENIGSEGQIQPGFLVLLRGELWRGYRDIFVAILADFVTFMLVLLALAGVRLLLSLLAKAGFASSDLLILERLHFWAYYVVFVIFSVDLVLKLVIGLFRK